ncbi:aminodeoxychorismate lyase [Kutzneria sp. NPDC051319]|uniref:aminodeoxychorismate lyase n=1 Tax=Kutzneria sp. NPDC051319 TaxID=3155047 RepID=UPI003424BE2A
MRVLAFLDGTTADPEAPLLRVDDLGLLRGDGVFETILVVDGKPRELAPHLDRLDRSAAMLELPEPDRAGWERAVDAVINNWSGGKDMALKLILTRGNEYGDGTPTAFAMGLPIADKVLKQRAEGIAAVTLERGFEPGLAQRAPWLLLGAKSLSYAVNMAAGRYAAREGADDVIFTAADGSVLEGPTSTLVLVRDRTLVTPPSTIGILPGTTQAALFRAAERASWSIKVEPIPAADLVEAEGLFLVSSVRCVTRIHTLDGHQLKDSSALLRELTALYESEY